MNVPGGGLRIHTCNEKEVAEFRWRDGPGGYLFCLEYTRENGWVGVGGERMRLGGRHVTIIVNTRTVYVGADSKLN
jgi:hypothetical protein